MRKLTTPLTEEEVKSLHAGDHVLLSGVVYTARDAAHLRMAPLVSKSDTDADHDDEDDWPRMQAWPKADTGGDLP